MAANTDRIFMAEQIKVRVLCEARGKAFDASKNK
jgi:hypothetical protein